MWLPPISIDLHGIDMKDCDPQYLRDYVSHIGMPEDILVYRMFKQGRVRDFKWDYEIPYPEKGKASTWRTRHPEVRNYTGYFSYDSMNQLFEPTRGSRLPRYEKRSNLIARLRPPHMVSLMQRRLAMVKASGALKRLRESAFSGDVRKFLIFTVHGEAVNFTAEFLRDLASVRIHAGMSGRKKRANIHKFGRHHFRRALVCNAEIAQCARGRDPDSPFCQQKTCRNIRKNRNCSPSDFDLLKRCPDSIVFIQAPWVFEDVVSCIKIIYNQQQLKPTFVTFMYLKRTLDEFVQTAAAEKVREYFSD